MKTLIVALLVLISTVVSAQTFHSTELLFSERLTTPHFIPCDIVFNFTPEKITVCGKDTVEFIVENTVFDEEFDEMIYYLAPNQRFAVIGLSKKNVHIWAGEGHYFYSISSAIL